jgi:hypothetical protein
MTRISLKTGDLLSHTNVEYKILTSKIALRRAEIIPNIIHENQSWFVKGRYIGENIPLTQDIMTSLKESGKSGLLLLLYFQKAFHSIECLDKMGLLSQNGLFVTSYGGLLSQVMGLLSHITWAFVT